MAKQTRLKTLLDERGQKLAQLARGLGLNKSTITKWNGSPPADRVPAIEALTGIPRHELRPDLWPAPFLPPDAPRIDRDTGKSLPRTGRAA